MKVQVNGAFIPINSFKDDDGAPEIPRLFVVYVVTNLPVEEFKHEKVCSNLSDFERGLHFPYASEPFFQLKGANKLSHGQAAYQCISGGDKLSSIDVDGSGFNFR